MPETLVAIRASVKPEALDSIPENYHSYLKEGALASSVMATSLWQSPEDPTQVLALHRYQSDEHAERAAERIADSPRLEEILRVFEGPPDIRRYRITNWQGPSEAAAALGSYLSISVRESEPGLGDELEDELAGIFEELKSLDGFLACGRARSCTLDEEVLGIALWGRSESFMRSLPANPIYGVELYRRIA